VERKRLRGATRSLRCNAQNINFFKFNSLALFSSLFLCFVCGVF
jgi:hypothetical protein